jgi:hypothetical protein
VKHRLQWWLAGVILVLLTFSVGGLAWLRLREARAFSQPHAVRTIGGTNYVVRFIETTLGRSDSNYLVIVQVRVENPNPFPLRLNRHWFILVDHDKDYYLPAMTGTQTEWFEVPGQGVADRVTLSYSVPADSFAGLLAVQLGQYYWVRLKQPTPYKPRLKSGEFVTFRRRDW